METLNLRLPALYADHHVIEVRQILSGLPGVENVYASSAFLTVEVEYDPARISAEQIEAGLDAAGYLSDLPVPAEVGAQPAGENGEKPFFRHTAAYAQAGNTVSFAQSMPFSGRPLWPCPGLGLIARAQDVEEEMEHAQE